MPNPQSKREVVEGLLKEVARTYPGQTGIVWNQANVSRILSIFDEQAKRIEELEKENAELRFQADVLGNEKCVHLSAEIREIIWDSVPEPQHSGMIQSPTVVLEYALEWMKKAKSELATLRAQGEGKIVEVIKAKRGAWAELNRVTPHQTYSNAVSVCDDILKRIQST